jgi:hypothetical protein
VLRKETAMLHAIAEVYRGVFGTPMHEEVVGGVLHQVFLVKDGTVELSFHSTLYKTMMSMVLLIVEASIEVSYDVVLEGNIATFRLALSKGELSSEEVEFSVQLPDGVHPIKAFLPGEEGPVPSFLQLSEQQERMLGSWVRKLAELM